MRRRPGGEDQGTSLAGSRAGVSNRPQMEVIRHACRAAADLAGIQKQPHLQG